MKIAIAGKGGVGKTTIAVLLADYLDRVLKYDVWMVDADPTLSLGMALGLSDDEIPIPLIQRKDLINERVGYGLINLNPKVDDLLEKLATKIGRKQLLVMGGISNADGGCACSANSLVKAILAHLVIDTQNSWIIVDLEAGVEHLGRGTVSSVNGLVIVSEPSFRSLKTANSISKLAYQLGLKKQVLVLNKSSQKQNLAFEQDLPSIVAEIPYLDGLINQQLISGKVIGLPEQNKIDSLCQKIINSLQ